MATEHRFIDGAGLPQKAILQFYRCESHGTCHVNVSDDFLQFMRRIFAKAGVELMFDEKKLGQFQPDQAHRAREILLAVHEVQGLPWNPHNSPLAAIESLVVKYAALK